MPRRILAALISLLLVSYTIAAADAESGHASWYAMTTLTASGERCDPTAFTAAHRSLPFGTRVKVENLRNGRWVVVRINDRGPFIHGRIIDLSRAAAGRLGFVRSGTARVRLTVLEAEAAAAILHHDF
jgi:rare lipoprotein A